MGLVSSMPIIGVHVVQKKLADGTPRFYYYAERGAKTSFWQTDGFRYDLRKQKLPFEFVQAFNEATRRKPIKQTFGALVADYLGEDDSPFNRRLSQSTRRDRRKYCDLIREIKLKGGKLALDAPLEAFENKAVRKYIRAWHQSMADTPKKADEAKIALSAVLQYGVARGDLTFNVARGIEGMYQRVEDARVWTTEEAEAFLSEASPVMRLGFQFIRYTGLRRKDAVEITTTADHGEHLVWRTSKSRRRHELLVPILPQLRPVMAELATLRGGFETPPMTILFNQRGLPWTPDGFSASFNKHRAKHELTPTIHGLRKNAATDWIIYQNQRPDLITDDMICDHFDWSRATLKKMKRIYVNRGAVIKAVLGH